MEKKKTEFRALIDKVSKERKRDGCLPVKTVNGKEKVDYYIFLKEILSKRTNSTFPASTDECLSALLLSSSILYEKTSVFSYKKSFKYACDINHPSLNNLINELDISELELQEIFDIAQQHNGELDCPEFSWHSWR